jgi:arabinofuranan 3-O-arabinosyltransferase
MALVQSQPANIELTRPVELTCFALCVTNVVYLGASFVYGSWLVDPQGQAIGTDFVNVWAGGRQVLDGNPAAAYDVVIHKGAEVAALGHPFHGEFPWNYPPSFLFVAALLGLIPYIQALAAWVFLTFPLYVTTIRGIIGDRIGILLAFGFPGILSNAMVGQNGYVTAALFGGALMFMERRPLLAGCLVGLLSFKPHLGILFPIVLIAGGHWRVIGAATIVVLLLFAASCLAFGVGTWEAFVQALPVVSQTTLGEGSADWAKLQSLFGLVRMIGGSEVLAWTLQTMLAAGVVIQLIAMWRSKISCDLKAAALVTGTLLCTPYLFIYDLVVLAVAMAFLFRAGRNAGELPGEMIGLGAASLLIFIYPFVQAPVGWLAILVVGLLTARRTLVSLMRIDLRTTGAAQFPLPARASK